jgi:hypothetical protein
MRDEVAPTYLANSNRGVSSVNLNIPILFYVYESIVTVLSLFFMAFGILLSRGEFELIAVTGPGEVVLSVIIVSIFKMGVAYGLYYKKWIAWVLAICVSVFSAIVTVLQLLGGFTGFSMWWLFVRFESGGNLFVILDVIFGVGPYQWIFFLIMLVVYVKIIHLLVDRKLEYIELV